MSCLHKHAETEIGYYAPAHKKRKSEKLFCTPTLAHEINKENECVEWTRKQGKKFDKVWTSASVDSRKKLLVHVERLWVKEVMISTPEEGYREVYYVGLSNNPKQKYEDWRIVKIKALSSPSPPNKSKQKLTSPGNVPTHHLTFPNDNCSVFRVDSVEDDLHSILSVLSGDKMSFKVLDASIMLCLDQYYDQVNSNPVELSDYKLRSKDKPRHINYQYISPRFMPVKKRDQCLKSLQVNMLYFPDFVKEEKDCVILAPQYVDKHFYLALIDFNKKSVQVHDSSWHYLPMEVRTAQLQTLLKAITKNWNEWKIDFVKKSSPQLDEYSCGVFTIFYAENLVKGLPATKNCRKLSKTKIEKIREHICRHLLTTTSNGRRFLEAISD